MGAVMLYLMVTCVFSVTIVDAQVSDGCQNPLGMKDGTILDSQLDSSTAYTVKDLRNHEATEGRLDGPSCWSAILLNIKQWIKVTFEIPVYVSGIILQGNPFDKEWEWVTAYKVKYYFDGYWQYVKDENQDEMTFQGNVDRNSHVTNLFTSKVRVTGIRIYPIEWNTHISMRFEILGCKVTDVILTTEANRSMPHIVTSSKVPHILTSTIASTASQKETVAGFKTTNVVLVVGVSLVVVGLILISAAVLLLCFKSRIGKSDVNTAPAENPDSTDLNPATTCETYDGDINMGMVDSTNTPQSILASPSDNQNLTYAYADVKQTTLNLSDDAYLIPDGDGTGYVTISPRHNDITSPKEDLDVDPTALDMTCSMYLKPDVSENNSTIPRRNVPIPPTVQLSTCGGGGVVTGYYVNAKR